MGGRTPEYLKTYSFSPKRAVRIISGAHYRAASPPLFKSLGFLNIHDIYKLRIAILMYQHHTGTLPCLFKTYFVTHLDTHNYNTRHKLNYRFEVARTNVIYFSVISNRLNPEFYTIYQIAGNCLFALINNK